MKSNGTFRELVWRTVVFPNFRGSPSICRVCPMRSWGHARCHLRTRVMKLLSCSSMGEEEAEVHLLAGFCVDPLEFVDDPM